LPSGFSSIRQLSQASDFNSEVFSQIAACSLIYRILTLERNGFADPEHSQVKILSEVIFKTLFRWLWIFKQLTLASIGQLVPVKKKGQL
jgi:hypothetical protein